MSAAQKVPLRLGLALAVDGDRVYAAGRKGDVAAFATRLGPSDLAYAHQGTALRLDGRWEWPHRRRVERR